MDLEEISRKAQKEREKEKASNQKQPQKPEKHATYDAMSFHTYSRIFPDQMNVVLWGMLMVLGLTLIIIHYTAEEAQAWSLYSGIACFAVFFLRLGVEYIRKMATYGEYKKFPSTLGFQLEGWEKLGSYPKQLYSRYWSEKTVIQIFVFEHAQQSELKYVKDTLDLFIATANKRFYEAEPGGDGRTKWKYHGSLRVLGSSGTSVIGDMYTMIHVHLRAIQEKYKIIRAVKVEFDPEIFKVEPPPSTD